MTPSELESKEQNSNADANTVGKEKRLAQISDGVGDARLVGVVARRVKPPRAALPPLQLLDRLSQSVLCLPEATLRGAVGGFVRLWRRGRRRRRRERSHCRGREQGLCIWKESRERMKEFGNKNVNFIVYNLIREN